MNELIKPKADIEIVNYAGIGVYNANKEANMGELRWQYGLKHIKAKNMMNTMIV